jgi:hypothetical protein
MSRSSGLRGRIQSATRRRERKPAVVARTLAPVTSRRRHELIEHHLAVLQRIETILFQCSTDDARVDDVTALSVISSLILNDPPMEMPAAWVYECQVRARSGQQPGEPYLDEPASVSDATGKLSDDDWMDCLRVVMESIRARSCLRPGDMQYLNFIGGFLPADF